MKKKIILLILIGTGIALFSLLDFQSHLTLESLKKNRGDIERFYQSNPWTLIGGFSGFYVLAVALSLPLATLLVLSAGATFGLWVGTLIVGIGDALGGTLAFLSARFLLRDWVRNRFGKNLKSFDEGFSKNAVNYLLFLRLVPVIPFFLVNLFSGLTRVSLNLFFWVTLFGSLPVTIVFVNVGDQLASIQNVEDILSARVFGSLFLAGVLILAPVIYKWFKNKRAVWSEI